MADIKGLTIGDLLTRLHRAILDFIETIEQTIKEDRQVDTREIRELREHIRERLQRNEDIEDNRKLLKVLDLFASNRAVMELVKEDAEDWMRFIDDIEKGMRGKEASADITEREMREINDIRRLTGEIREVLRRG